MRMLLVRVVERVTDLALAREDRRAVHLVAHLGAEEVGELPAERSR